MIYTWSVRYATLFPPQPDGEPPQLEDVLNALTREGWEIFSVIPEATQLRARVIARRLVESFDGK